MTERICASTSKLTIPPTDEAVFVSPPPAFDATESSSSPSSLPASGSALYGFSFPLSNLYSFVLSAPTFSNWYGTLVLSLLGGVAMPTLHFHDDESQSTILGLQRATRSGADAPADAHSAAPYGGGGGGGVAQGRGSVSSNGQNGGSTSPCTWGGDELLHQLRRYALVIRSVLQPNLFLVNPSRADMETHTTPIFDDDAIDPPSHHAGAGGGGVVAGLPSAHRTPLGSRPGGGSHGGPEAKMDPLVMWAKTTRLSFLDSFSQITRTARQATAQVLSHPLAKPYLGHLPGPVQSFAHAGPVPLGPLSDAEWGRIAAQGGVGEYDSARVYLAKWARLVAEEGERNKRSEDALLGASEADLRASAKNGRTMGSGKAGAGAEPSEEIGQLGVFELLAKSADVPRPPTTRVQGSPIGLQEWQSLFDSGTGKPLHSEASIKQRVFAHGLADAPTRRQAWPFLLGVLPWDSNRQKREEIWRKKSEQYWSIKREWENNAALLEREDILEQRHRIRVDCLRTDRGHPLFKVAEPSEAGMQPDQAPSYMSASIIQTKEAGHSAATSNENVVRLGEILLTFGMWEADNGKLGGYVQGMSDLCSLLYVVCDGDEPLTFWCFVALMERMAPNFYADQSGMKKLLLALQKLIAVMDPALYSHLEKADSLNLFFCFR